jgi:O-antigen ligase
MLVYQSGKRDMMYAQAHNDYLQLAAEGGVLVVAPALVALVLLVRSIQRRMASPDDDVLTSWVRIGAVAGLVGIGVQSAMEFSLQMPGNVVMFAFVAGLAMHRPRRSGRAHRI